MPVSLVYFRSCNEDINGLHSNIDNCISNCNVIFACSFVNAVNINGCSFMNTKETPANHILFGFLFVLRRFVLRKIKNLILLAFFYASKQNDLLQTRMNSG